MKLTVKTQTAKYDVLIEQGALNKRSESFFKLGRSVLAVTDEGVPSEYVTALSKGCKRLVKLVLPQGEPCKSITVYGHILDTLYKNGFTRNDCIVAIGGGAVGDVAGFAASTYMRGIDFYNVPTTLLSQLDSSIGGKTAINFSGVKNLVGSFYQPKGVLIDSGTLSTLPSCHISNGYAEAVKMALTCDADLFEAIEKDGLNSDINTVITRCLEIKKSIVEKDERENGLRRVLNFGHTVAHARESALSGRCLHGECVAVGMVPMCSKAVQKRLVPLLKRLDLPYELDISPETVIDFARHDKKLSGNCINVITVNEIGTYSAKIMSLEQLREVLR